MEDQIEEGVEPEGTHGEDIRHQAHTERQKTGPRIFGGRYKIGNGNDDEIHAKEMEGRSMNEISLDEDIQGTDGPCRDIGSYPLIS